MFDPNVHDGMGLNSATNKSDNVAKYYGENYMANDIRLAKNAVVILSHLCYASGNSESAATPSPRTPSPGSGSTTSRRASCGPARAP